jgi:hypothetical protein
MRPRVVVRWNRDISGALFALLMLAACSATTKGECAKDSDCRSGEFCYVGQCLLGRLDGGSRGAEDGGAATGDARIDADGAEPRDSGDDDRGIEPSFDAGSRDGEIAVDAATRDGDASSPDAARDPGVDGGQPIGGDGGLPMYRLAVDEQTALATYTVSGTLVTGTERFPVTSAEGRPVFRPAANGAREVAIGRDSASGTNPIQTDIIDLLSGMTVDSMSASDPEWSRDGRLLFGIRETCVEVHDRLMIAHDACLTTPGTPSKLRVDPLNTRVAMLLSSAVGTLSLDVLELQNRIMLVPLRDGVHDYAWAPSGLELAIVQDSASSAQTGCELARISSSGGTPTSLVTNVACSAIIDWSTTDMLALVEVATGAGLAGAIYFIDPSDPALPTDLASRTPDAVLQTDARAIAWTPDGIYLAFASLGSPSSQSVDISFVSPASGVIPVVIGISGGLFSFAP